MILLIDNYDSFTWNLVHYMGEAGAEVVVRRNDVLSVDEALAMQAQGIVISPGPCDPAHAGIIVPLIRAAAERQIPLFGRQAPSKRPWNDGRCASSSDSVFLPNLQSGSACCCS